MQKTVANQNAAHDHSSGRNTLEPHALLPLPMALCLRLFFLEIPRECHVASSVNLPSFFFVPSPVAAVYLLFGERACQTRSLRTGSPPGRAFQAKSRLHTSPSHVGITGLETSIINPTIKPGMSTFFTSQLFSDCAVPCINSNAVSGRIQYIAVASR